MGHGFLPIVHGAAADRPDEVDTIVCADVIGAALARLGYETQTTVLGLDLSPLERLAARGPVAVFNLVESLCGDARLAHLPFWAMDHLGLAYTGTRTLAYLETMSKLTTKRRLHALGLPTAPWWERGQAVPADATVIVKSVWEHASLGMDAESVVPGRRAAAAIAERERRYGGTFFAEAFIDGREFNVALIEEDEGPSVLPIPEMTFDGFPQGRPRIVDYEAKWDAQSVAYNSTMRRFGIESSDAALAGRLAEIALGCWRGFGLNGYARVDFRVNSAGIPYILEVNANPCLAPDAGFVATATAAGIAFDPLIARIVAAGARQPRQVM